MGLKLLHRWRAIKSKAVTALLAVFHCLIVSIATLAAGELPDHFVYLKDLDPSILQDMRYAGRFNFTGAPVPGYGHAECILQRTAAEALKNVQAAAREKGLLLKVFDCYRPQKATRAFVEWVHNPQGNEFPDEFYPGGSKSSLFKQNYISKNSGHSLGFAVDLTLVRPGDRPVATKARGGGACNGPLETRPLESSLDFGTTFDCFTKESHTRFAGLAKQAKDNRALLVELMARYGFENYHREWWHFQLKPIPKGSRPHDFDIPKHASE